MCETCHHSHKWCRPITQGACYEESLSCHMLDRRPSKLQYSPTVIYATSQKVPCIIVISHTEGGLLGLDNASKVNVTLEF